MRELAQLQASRARIACFGSAIPVLSCAAYFGRRSRNTVDPKRWHGSFAAEMFPGCAVDIGYVRGRDERPTIAPSSGGVFHFVRLELDGQPVRRYLVSGGAGSYVKTLAQVRSDGGWGRVGGPASARRLWIVDDRRRVVFALDVQTGE